MSLSKPRAEKIKRNWEMLLSSSHPLNKIRKPDSAVDAVTIGREGKLVFLYPDGTWDIEDMDAVEDDRDFN